MSAERPLGPVPARSTEVELFSVAGVDGYFREVNARFAGLLGVESSALSGCSVLELVHPDDVPEVVAGLASLEAGATEVVLENRFKQQGGGWTHLQWVVRPLDGTDLWWAAGRDTTPYHLLMTEGADLRARLDLAVGHATAAMWELSVKEGRVTWEPQAADLLDVPVDDLPQTMAALAAVVHPRDAPVVQSAQDELLRSGRVDVELQIGEGATIRHLSFRGKVLERDRRGRPLRAVGLLVDLTTEKAMEQHMLRMVMSDALTGVPNRRAFDQMLRTGWRECAIGADPLSIVMMDIDNFKLFNDTFGHLIGDEVLTLVARSLTDGLDRQADSVARFGGEEFALVLPRVDSGEALAIAQRLCEAVRGVTVRQAQGWGLSISVGVATWRPTDKTVKPAQLVSRADQALYVAKLEGKNRAVSYGAALADRAVLESAIRAGIDAGEFELHYQPMVDAGTGSVAGLEALMRWNRPGYGTVLPGGFIPVAEKSDLVDELGRLALGEACAQLAAWIDAGVEPCTRVAVNLSAHHLANPAVVAVVAAALSGSGLAPERLEIELTETALDRPLVREHVTQIRGLGVSVSLDDFGTGRTSLQELGQLPIDVLKIDPTFLTSSRPGQRDLIALLIGAAHAFGVLVVAEQVEDLGVVTGLGCDLVQGYAVARPMPAPAVLGWLRSPHAPGSAA